MHWKYCVLHALPNLLRTSTVTRNLKNGKNSMMHRIKNYSSTVIYQVYIYIYDIQNFI
jgi:hypothetical protein